MNKHVCIYYVVVTDLNGPVPFQIILLCYQKFLEDSVSRLLAMPQSLWIHFFYSGKEEFQHCLPYHNDMC